MGNLMSKEQAAKKFAELLAEYDIYAPVVFEGGGRYTDIDCVRYAKIEKFEDIEFERKNEYSFKEAFLPVNEILFHYTQNDVKVPDFEEKKKIILLRSCELNAVRALDEIYLENGREDPYYKRRRENTIFYLIECPHSYENCFCVSMGSNKCEGFDAFIRVNDDGVYMSEDPSEVKFIEENDIKVSIPDNLSHKVNESKIWDEYTARCIACGRCNFVCPTCTCFTMQDISYMENGDVGERRRVWASCMVDGYDEIAGGITFRKNKGERMRYKVMHKVYDFKKRFDYTMCVGCGRCDDTCPEYISYSNCLNKLDGAMKEVQG
jgi:anaerobic sulfite reductase subunit A